MIKIIKADQRHYSDFGWLKTYWLFSFADYNDPANINHGALRVFNDDIVERGAGFPSHPHHEMEIVTVVLSGEIAHEDSMGNKTIIKAGDVQRMSAGTGLTHSEHNQGDKPVHFYQIWIFPDRKGLKPSYGQMSFEPSKWRNRLLQIASGQDSDDVVSINTDASIYKGALESGKKIEYITDDSRMVFIYVTDGELRINGEILNKSDQARISGETEILLEASKSADFILIDVLAREGWG
ncbi:MAG: pirin family protein [candidate division Zixibacteria bacterium]